MHANLYNMFQSYNLTSFIQSFSTADQCHAYLAAIKSQKPYSCVRCKHTNYCKTKQIGARKCTSCKHIESATAGTLFHKCKLGLPNAFLIVFLVTTTKKGMSSYELHRKTGKRQPSCYNFKRKIAAAMQEQCATKLVGTIQVDESIYGGYMAGKPGRSKSTKKEFVLAIENKGAKILNCVAQYIENAGTKQLLPFFEKHINNSTIIKTDKWRGYTPIMKSYPFLEQINSDWTNKFKLIHRQIMMIKGWLRGTHHHVKNLQMYLDEFCYKNNNRGKQIFHKIISTMMHTKQVYIKNMIKFGGS